MERPKPASFYYPEKAFSSHEPKVFPDISVTNFDLQKTQLLWQRQEGPTTLTFAQKEDYQEWKAYLETLLADKEHTFLLTGTGFDTVMQIRRFVQTCNKNEDFQVAKSAAIKEMLLDMEGYLWEFLEKRPVLAQKLLITSEGGLVAPEYSDTPLFEATNANERGGATIEAVEKLEAFLSQAKGGDVFVIASPAGWSGLKDEKGNPLVFPEAQVYAYQVAGDEKTIQGVTFRTSLSLEKLEGLQQDLSEGNFQAKKAPKKQRIRNLSAFVAQTNLTSFPQVVDQMQETAGTKAAKIDEKNEIIYTFEDLKQSLISQQEIDQVTARILADFEKFVKEDINDLSDPSLRELAVKMGKAILDMSMVLQKKETTGKNLQYENEKVDEIDPYIIYEPLAKKTSESDHERYQRALLQRQQEDEGCMARIAAENIRVIETPFGPRLAVRLVGKDKYGPLEFSCPHCNRKNTRLYNTLLTNCTHCGRDVRCG